MRRILSIATIAALISSFLSPLMAAACTGTGKAVSCHAAEAPSSEPVMHEHHHHHDAAPTQKSKSALSASADETKCPMDCCTPGHLRTGAAVATNTFLPPLAVSNGKSHFVSVTFTSAGFSSHTDRGPPSLLV
jgi:predicted cobalt transporter CbtA